MVGRRFNFCAKTVYLPCKKIILFQLIQLIIFLQDLYNWLEVEFNPLSLCNKMEAKLKVGNINHVFFWLPMIFVIGVGDL
jgi:hypothetical protein